MADSALLVLITTWQLYWPRAVWFGSVYRAPRHAHLCHAVPLNWCVRASCADAACEARNGMRAFRGERATRGVARDREGQDARREAFGQRRANQRHQLRRRVLTPWGAPSPLLLLPCNAILRVPMASTHFTLLKQCSEETSTAPTPPNPPEPPHMVSPSRPTLLSSIPSPSSLSASESSTHMVVPGAPPVDDSPELTPPGCPEVATQSANNTAKGHVATALPLQPTSRSMTSPVFKGAIPTQPHILAHGRTFPFLVLSLRVVDYTLIDGLQQEHASSSVPGPTPPQLPSNPAPAAHPRDDLPMSPVHWTTTAADGGTLGLAMPCASQTQPKLELEPEPQSHWEVETNSSLSTMMFGSRPSTAPALSNLLLMPIPKLLHTPTKRTMSIIIDAPNTTTHLS